MNIIKHKNWFFGLSLLVIIPGLISLAVWGLNLSIDFTGGSEMTWQFAKPVTLQVKQVITQTAQIDKVKLQSFKPSGNTLQFRTDTLSDEQHQQFVTDAKKTMSFTESEYATIGPTIGGETTKNALLGLLVASLLIVLYIAWSFREVPKPTSSWRFGIAAIIALLHDALVLLGIFSLLGHFAGVEVDSLFVTAILTVIGFSVHDTIVVFDRIRENLHKMGATDFPHVVNVSILQTMTRSLNTSLTVLLVLFALLLFGGDSTRWFVAALLIGILSGTYSSIFNAAPILVLWQELKNKSEKRKA
jgi:preprotein translocase subunit SecF